MTTTTNTYTYKSKGCAVALALLLGGFGAHRFYLGNAWVGCAYILFTAVFFLTPFFWLPGLVVLMDAIYIATEKQEYFKRLSGVVEVVN